MFGLFRNRTRDTVSARVYAEVTEGARRPTFYDEFGVPDTVDGRYDMMVLHLFLYVRWLKPADKAAQAVSQEACDYFFTQMDRAMREMGVGDLSVPKKMKRLGEVYAGCSAAYDAGLASDDPAELMQALRRNVYADAPAMTAQAEALAAYVRAADRALGATPLPRLLEGRIPYPEPVSGERP